MKRFNKTYLLFILFFGTNLGLPAQELLSSVKIHGSNDDSNPSTNVVEDDEGNYYVHVRNNSDTVFFGNKYRLRGEDPPWYDGSPEVNYIVKINAVMAVEDVWKIKNAEVWDFDVEDGVLYLIGRYPHEESLFLMDDQVLGVDVEEGYQSFFILSVDASKEIRFIEYFKVKSSGGFNFIQVDGNFIYISGTYDLIIDLYDEILYPWDGIPDSTATGSSDTQIFMAKIDQAMDTLCWLQRMGGDSGREFLQDMKLDQEGNLVFCGLARTRFFHFTEGDSLETTAGASTYESFLGKLSPEGELLFGIITPETFYDECIDIFISPSNNIYLTSILYSEELVLPDTLLYNNPLNWRGFLVKYNQNGGFQWVHLLEGDSEKLWYHDISFDQESNLVAAGFFKTEFIQLMGVNYFVQGGSNDKMINTIDRNTGKVLKTKLIVGINHQALPFIDVTENGNWKLFLEQEDSDEVFDHNLENEGKHWFFMEFDPDIVNSTVESNNQAESDIFSTYPNPILGQFDSTFHNNIRTEPGMVSIYDCKGQNIFVVSKTQDQDNLRINSDHWPSGSYYILFRNHQKNYIKKILKM